MKNEVLFYIDNDVYEKFCMALRLNGEDENDAIERSLREYISKTFERISHEYSGSGGKSTSENQERNYYGKAIRRIPSWALKPNQYNHKIIRAFFEAEEHSGEVLLADMEALCSDKIRSELYVPTFRNNYSQLKIDGPQSYGKVFEDDGERVWIWDEVEAVLRKHKDSFMKK